MAYTGTSASGKTYNIGSEKGLDFINNSAAGSTLVGGDGSTWTKNADGTTTISKNGETYTVGAANTNNYFPTSNGQGSVPSGYYTQNANVVTGTVTAPNGDTLSLHNWATDTTDYSALMANAKSYAEFQTYAQARVNKANAQGIDISGNGTVQSNADIHNTWYNNYYKNVPDTFTINDVQGQGYYGMDGSGNWGYYADQELTQKLSNGGWDKYKASDGGYALFDSSKGYLWPSAVRDTSRAGRTVTLVAGAQAFDVKYNELGYVVSVTNLNQTKGINGNDLNLPTAKSLNDQGLGGQALLQQASGVDYVGPGGASYDDVRAATRADYEALMAKLNGGAAGDSTGAGMTAGAGGTSINNSYGYTDSYGGASGGSYYGGTSLTDELKALYNGSDSVYMQALADLKAANEAAVRRTTNALEAQKTDVNSGYSDLFRQLYINRMNNQKNIAQRLAAQGVTGGAAESTLLGLATNYEDALRQGEESRIGAISDLDQAIEDAKLSGDISTATTAASLARENVNNYAGVLRTLIAQQNTDRQFAADQEALAWNRAYQLSRDALSDARYESEWAYQQAQAEAARQLQLAQLAAGYGDYSGLDGLGVDSSAYVSQLAEAQTAAKPALTAAQTLAAIKAGTLTQNVLDAYEYYYGEPYGGTGAASGGSGVSYNNGGLTSSQVKQLQAKLGVTQDGFFGPASQAAAKAQYGTTSAATAYALAFGGAGSAASAGRGTPQVS